MTMEEKIIDIKPSNIVHPKLDHISMTIRDTPVKIAVGLEVLD